MVGQTNKQRLLLYIKRFQIQIIWRDGEIQRLQKRNTEIIERCRNTEIVEKKYRYYGEIEKYRDCRKEIQILWRDGEIQRLKKRNTEIIERWRNTEIVEKKY